MKIKYCCWIERDETLIKKENSKPTQKKERKKERSNVRL